MNTQHPEFTPTSTHKTPDDEIIAIHVLHYLTTRQMNGTPIQFDALRRHLPVRRMELVRILGRLDRQGLIDCSRLRVTLSGFAIGTSLREADLPELRATSASVRAA